MPRRPEFVDHVIEQLAPLGYLSARAMFGGWGLYSDGLFFAIVIDDELFFKADAENRTFYTSAGSTPFQYGRSDGRTTTLQYYRVPADVLEEAPLLQRWAREGLAAALRQRR